MSRYFSSYLVTPQELHNALTREQSSEKQSQPKTIPLCASWFLPNDPKKRTGLDAFVQGHIPTARFFDLDKVADTSSLYPHMLPTAEVFMKAMGDLGATKDDTIVVYDTAELGIFSAPRVAWTLRVFGHPAVHILNNFKLWEEQGLPTEQGQQQDFEKTTYQGAVLDESKVAAFEEIKDIAEKHNASGKRDIQILDARSGGRFRGSDAEPRPGLPSGHIPGSISVPMSDLLDPVTKAFLPAEELRAFFQSKDIDPNKPIVSSCGTGVSAAVIDAALMEAGYQRGSRRIYDGSWTEWAQRAKAEDNLIRKTA